MTFLRNLLKIKTIVDREVGVLLLLSFLVGLLLFGAELSFVFALQGYLREIGLLASEKTNLPSFFPNGLIPALLIFLFVGCFRVFVLMAKTYLSSVANQTFLRKKRQLFFEYGIYNAQKLNSHEVMSLVSDTLSRCSGSIIDLSNVIVILSSTIFLFISGLMIAPKEMLLGVSVAAFLMFPIRWLNFAIDRPGRGLTEEWASSNKSLSQGMKHSYFLKAHGLEKLIITRGLASIKRYEGYYKSFFLYSSFRNALPTVLGLCLIIGISYMSKVIFMTESAALLSFLYLFLRLAQGASDLFVNIGFLQLNLNSIDETIAWEKRAIHFLSNKEKRKERAVEKILEQKAININFNNVSFAYEDQKVLSDLSLNIGPGDILIVQGESGVGKSTLTSLVLGMNIPTSGEVLFNGTAVNADTLYEHQHLFAYVGPDPFLFEGTIRENLLFGNDRAAEINDHEIMKILKRVNLESFISVLELGLDHKFDEHVEASTGQKQRLSLCRALLREPTLLILDEATANLDPETEEAIIEVLLPMLKEITSIIITHKGHLSDYGTSLLRLERDHKYTIKEIN